MRQNNMVHSGTTTFWVCGLAHCVVGGFAAANQCPLLPQHKWGVVAGCNSDQFFQERLLK